MTTEVSITLKGGTPGASALTLPIALKYSSFSEGLLPNKKHFSSSTLTPYCVQRRSLACCTSCRLWSHSCILECRCLHNKACVQNKGNALLLARGARFNTAHAYESHLLQDPLYCLLLCVLCSFVFGVLAFVLIHFSSFSRVDRGLQLHANTCTKCHA
jgi:hypothetical protein